MWPFSKREREPERVNTVRPPVKPLSIGMVDGYIPKSLDEWQTYYIHGHYFQFWDGVHKIAHVWVNCPINDTVEIRGTHPQLGCECCLTHPESDAYKWGSTRYFTPQEALDFLTDYWIERKATEAAEAKRQADLRMRFAERFPGVKYTSRELVSDL